MKKYFLVLPILFSQVQPAFSQKGAFTIGFNWEVLSRGGYTVGYFVSNNLALEAHFGGVPHVATWGLSAKYKPFSKHPTFYLILGASNVTFFGHVQKDSLGNEFYHYSSAYGINWGLGKEVGFKNPKWKMPIELGIFRSFHLRAKRIEPETKKVQTIDLSGNDSTPFAGFAGFGITWYSRH